MIGYIVIALVLIPVALFIATFTLEKPRKWRIPAMLVTSLLVQTAGIVAFLALFGALLGLLVP